MVTTSKLSVRTRLIVATTEAALLDAATLAGTLAGTLDAATDAAVDAATLDTVAPTLDVVTLTTLDGVWVVEPEPPQAVKNVAKLARPIK